MNTSSLSATPAVADAAAPVQLSPEFCARIDAGAREAAEHWFLKDQLSRAALKLRGTKHSSYYPDSLGDRMVRSSLFISMLWMDSIRVRRDEILAEARALLAEFTALTPTA